MGTAVSLDRKVQRATMMKIAAVALCICSLVEAFPAGTPQAESAALTSGLNNIRVDSSRVAEQAAGLAKNFKTDSASKKEKEDKKVREANDLVNQAAQEAQKLGEEAAKATAEADAAKRDATTKAAAQAASSKTAADAIVQAAAREAAAAEGQVAEANAQP